MPISVNEPATPATTETSTSGSPHSLNEPATPPFSAQPDTPPEPAEPPVITALTPASAIIGAADAVVTVTGTGFTATSIVNFDGVDADTDYASATEISFLAPLSSISTAGGVDVIVHNTGIDSTPFVFTMDAA